MTNLVTDISLRKAAVVAAVAILVMVVGEVGLAVRLLFKGGKIQMGNAPVLESS